MLLIFSCLWLFFFMLLQNNMKFLSWIMKQRIIQFCLHVFAKQKSKQPNEIIFHNRILLVIRNNVVYITSSWMKNVSWKKLNAKLYFSFCIWWNIFFKEAHFTQPSECEVNNTIKTLQVQKYLWEIVLSANNHFSFLKKVNKILYKF